MTTKINWLYRGVGHGEGALIVGNESNRYAVARFIEELWEGEIELPNGAEITLWCGNEHFKFREFDSEFDLKRGEQGITNLRFSAECERDGRVQFGWDETRPEAHNCAERRFVDSISIWKP